MIIIIIIIIIIMIIMITIIINKRCNCGNEVRSSYSKHHLLKQ